MVFVRVNDEMELKQWFLYIFKDYFLYTHLSLLYFFYYFILSLTFKSMFLEAIIDQVLRTHHPVGRALIQVIDRGDDQEVVIQVQALALDLDLGLGPCHVRTQGSYNNHCFSLRSLSFFKKILNLHMQYRRRRSRSRSDSSRRRRRSDSRSASPDIRPSFGNPKQNHSRSPTPKL